MKKLTITLGLLLIIISPLFGGIAEAIGTWDCELYVDVIGENFPITLILTDEEGKLSGKMAGDQGEYPMESISYSDGSLKFEVYVDAAGTIQFDLNVSGEKIEGTAGNAEFDGTVEGTKKE